MAPAPLPSASPSLLDVLQGFVHELRTAGLPVSMTENLDAMRALHFIDIDDREMFKAVLSATLVKHEGSPENIAQAVLAFVDNDFVTGACLPVDGGRTVFAPE